MTEDNIINTWIRIAGIDFKVPVKNFKFTVNNHLDDYGIPTMPQTRELEFTIDYQPVDPTLIRWIGTKIIDSETYVMTPVSEKKKVKPKFTTAQKRAMR